jgi:hypothetical protein
MVRGWDSCTPGGICRWEDCKNERNKHRFLENEDEVFFYLFFFFQCCQESGATRQDGDGEKAKTEQKQERKEVEEIRKREERQRDKKKIRCRQTDCVLVEMKG